MHIFRGAAPGWGRVVCRCLSSREKTVQLRLGVRLGSPKLPIQQIFLIHPQVSLRYSCFPVHTRSGKLVASLSSSSSSSLDTQNTRDCGSETYTVIQQKKKPLNETYPASWVSFPWLLQRHFKSLVTKLQTSGEATSVELRSLLLVYIYIRF